MPGPETRPSLILRVRDPQHHEAWEEFVAIYQPLIYRLAVKKGFQHADANDLCQEVLAAVGKSIDRFDPDPEKGAFRGWLSRITRNLMINVLTRDRQTRGSGDSAVMQLLEQQADHDCEEATCFDMEYERAVFHWASDRVRQHVEESTWKAFWMTAVDGLAAEKVATVLGKSAGSVRVARCRVLARIKREVDRIESSRTPAGSGNEVRT